MRPALAVVTTLLSFSIAVRTASAADSAQGPSGASSTVSSPGTGGTSPTGPAEPGTGNSGGGRTSGLNTTVHGLTLTGGRSAAGGGGFAPPAGPSGAPAPKSPFAGANPETTKAGFELQTGDLASACLHATSALKADPKDAKAAAIMREACKSGLSSGPKESPDSQGGGTVRDVALGPGSQAQLLRGGLPRGGVLAPPAAELQPLLARIKSAADSGDDAGVVTMADEGLRDFPKDPYLLDLKTQALLRLKDWRRALQAADEALLVPPDRATAHANRAAALKARGDREGMLSELRKAAALDPSFEAMLQAALKDGAASLFGDVGGRWPRAKVLWAAGAAAAGLLLVLIIVLLLRRPRGDWTGTPKAGAASAAATVIDGIGSGVVLPGGYRVDGELGRGGMGVVFDAFDQNLQRRVAIKQLKRDASTTQQDVERFLKEARFVAQLKHPNLAEIYTVLDHGGELLLVFEYVDGRTLDKVIAAHRRLPVDHAVRVLAEVASALDYAHAQKIIHRDLKPSNVMVGKDGRVKVMDFGIAHRVSGTADATRTTASGTPAYMAPEQAMGSVSRTADVYALAVMAYEMTLGARPFEGPDFLEQKLQRRFTPVAQRDASAPPALDALFTAAFDPDPTKRPATGGDFVAAFKRAAGHA